MSFSRPPTQPQPASASQADSPLPTSAPPLVNVPPTQIPASEPSALHTMGGTPQNAPAPPQSVSVPQSQPQPQPQSQAQSQGQAPAPVPVPVPPRLVELLDQVKAEFATMTVETSRLMLTKNEADSKVIQQHMGDLTQIRKIIYELDQAHRQMRESYESEISKLRHRLDSVQPQPPLLSRIEQTDNVSNDILPMPNGDSNAETANRTDQNKDGREPKSPYASNSAQNSAPPGGAFGGVSTTNGYSTAPNTATANTANANNTNASSSSQTPSTSGENRDQHEQRDVSMSSAVPPEEDRKPDIHDMDVDRDADKYADKDADQTNDKENNKSSSEKPEAYGADGTSVSSNSSVGSSSAGSSTSPAEPPKTHEGSGESTGGATATNGGATNANGGATNATTTTTATTNSNGDSASDTGNTPNVDQTMALSSLNFDELPAEFKKEGDGYKVVYNPKQPPKLDVELVRSLQHSSVVCCVRFSNDGKLLATGCNRSAQIFDVASGELLFRLQDPNVDDTIDLYIRSVCFSPDGQLLATGAEDHKIRIWDIKKGEIKLVLSGHAQDIYSLAYSISGRYLVSGSGDRKVKMWDVETTQCFREFIIDDGVTAVALSPDDRFVAAGSLDRSVRIWDIEFSQLVEKLDGEDGHNDSVYSVSYLPDGRELVSGSLDRTLKVWSLSPQGESKKGHVRKTIRGHNDYVLSVAVTPDSKYILSGSKDRTVQMWDAASGEVQLMLHAHVNSVISVAQSPEGPLFASGGGDFSAKIWKYTEK